MFKRTPSSRHGFEFFTATPINTDLLMHTSMDQFRLALRKTRKGERYGGFLVPVSRIRIGGESLGSIDTMVMQEISTAVSYILSGCGCDPGAELSKQNIICAIAHNLAIVYSATHTDSDTQQLVLAGFYSAVDQNRNDETFLEYTMNLAVYNAFPQPNVLEIMDDDIGQLAAFCAFPL